MLVRVSLNIVKGESGFSKENLKEKHGNSHKNDPIADD